MGGNQGENGKRGEDFFVGGYPGRAATGVGDRRGEGSENRGVEAKACRTRRRQK